MSSDYIKNFMGHHGYGMDDWIGCSVCGKGADHIHHVVFRSRQGSDDPSNLIALCLNCHDRAHFRATPYLDQEDLKKIVAKCCKECYSKINS